MCVLLYSSLLPLEKRNLQFENPKMYGIDVPVLADSVESPIVSYGEGPVSINFVAEDLSWSRVTFEKLDSLRISRGEHKPYDFDWKRDGTRKWVSIVSPSPWLRERYEYEKLHYGESYEFGGDVDEMLRDYSHYVFSFHDQFVEAICAGIWIESAEKFIGNREIDQNHPFHDLPALNAETFESSGIACQIRRNARPIENIVKDAELCSQKLLQFAAVLDGSTSVSWTLDLRARNGKLRSYLKRYFGNVEESYEGIATLQNVLPHVRNWLKEVKERRKQMGKE
ncbi:hypothetical protein ANRL1_01214 [Anaerolineae bacterium]|nr:hypothetical protein ANRL1_01214 [Anaerolineae bacterium]